MEPGTSPPLHQPVLWAEEIVQLAGLSSGSERPPHRLLHRDGAIWATAVVGHAHTLMYRVSPSRPLCPVPNSLPRAITALYQLIAHGTVWGNI
jgi:hypothetical protein